MKPRETVMDPPRDLFFYAERQGQGIAEASLEVAGAARALLDRGGGQLIAVVTGPGARSRA